MIFEHIVGNKNSPSTTINNDLSLLSATVSYFAEMRSQMRLLATVCSRLQHTSSVYLQLAQNHVSRRLSIEPTHKKLKAPIDHGQHCNDLIDLDIRNVNVANYLEWLPTEINPTITTQPGDQHEPACIGVSQIRRISGNMFDWFSWDAYYAGAET